MIRALLAVSLFAFALSAAPARVLFPANLHLTREVHDPLTPGVTTVDEYCSGNRMVSVSGDRTVIVDYEMQEITEIDRRAGTYSVARFSEIAGGTRAAAAKAGPRGKVSVEIDRSFALTREALEVLIGAAYPNTPHAEHEAVLRAASLEPEQKGIAASEARSTYGLPVSQTFTYGDAESEVTVRSAITRVGNETVPAEALIIPPSARRIEPRRIAIERQLGELDRP